MMWLTGTEGTPFPPGTYIEVVRTCPQCGGTGHPPLPSSLAVCPACRGAGQTRELASPARLAEAPVAHERRKAGGA